jgi:hypothetical protein
MEARRSVQRSRHLGALDAASINTVFRRYDIATIGALPWNG